MAVTSEESAPAEAAANDYRNLSIIIPAYNEEDGIQATLERLRTFFPAAEIVVVDDGSQDQTAQRAAGFAGVKLLAHRFNRGYGGALKRSEEQKSELQSLMRSSYAVFYLKKKKLQR